jgi:hypothetical protein
MHDVPHMEPLTVRCHLCMVEFDNYPGTLCCCKRLQRSILGGLIDRREATAM